MLLSDHHDVAPRVKRYFCAHLPAPWARGVIRGEQQQKQESKSAAITKFFLHFCLLGGGSMKSLVRYDWTHAVENVTNIATVAVVRPRVSTHTLACSSVARKKGKDVQTQCVIYVS